MKALLNKSVLEGLLRRLEAATRLLLFIDYDSVLLPAAAGGLPVPLDPDEREYLRELSEKDALTLIIISNRSLAGLKKIIGFSGIYLVANNGMEIHGPDLNVVHAEAKSTRKILGDVVDKLAAEIPDLPGVVLDNRGLSLALNIFAAKPAFQRRARLLMEQIWTPVMDTFTLYEARHELIIRPRVGWGKSRAVMFIWNKFASPRRRPFVINIGADESDEEIFGLVGREGIGVVVGGNNRAVRSKAGYQLRSRSELNKFLAWLSQNVSRIHSPRITGK